MGSVYDIRMITSLFCVVIQQLWSAGGIEPLTFCLLRIVLLTLIQTHTVQ